MESLKIPKGSNGISKTLRLPAELIQDMESLAELKHTSLNQIAIILLKFSLDNLDDKERVILEKHKKQKIQKSSAV